MTLTEILDKADENVLNGVSCMEKARTYAEERNSKEMTEQLLSARGYMNFAMICYDTAVSKIEKEAIRCENVCAGLEKLFVQMEKICTTERKEKENPLERLIDEAIDT